MMHHSFNILICCNRCKTSFFSDSNYAQLYSYVNTSGELEKNAVLYSCPDCDSIGFSVSWVHTRKRRLRIK